MFQSVRIPLVFFLCCSAAIASDIYRFRMADGRTVFSDNPTAPTGTVETSRVSAASNRLVAIAPETPQSTPESRDRAGNEVRQAEAALLGAYNRLTAGVLPRAEEILPFANEDPSPAPRRGQRREVPKTTDYYQRIDSLKSDITRAQERLDAARERFYSLK